MIWYCFDTRVMVLNCILPSSGMTNMASGGIYKIKKQDLYHHKFIFKTKKAFQIWRNKSRRVSYISSATNMLSNYKSHVISYLLTSYHITDINVSVQGNVLLIPPPTTSCLTLRCSTQPAWSLSVGIYNKVASEIKLNAILLMGRSIQTQDTLWRQHR